jgi:hypothetical protein
MPSTSGAVVAMRAEDCYPKGKRHDRTGDVITLDAVERIAI